VTDSAAIIDQLQIPALRPLKVETSFDRIT
jgi:hypothetical protein